MLQALFTSRVRIQLLSVFVVHPDSLFHARLLATMTGAHYSAVWKELHNLEQVGFLLSERSAHVKTYQVNPHFPILPELRAIMLKTVGLGDALRQALTASAAIEAAFVYGSFARGDLDQSSDVDLMLIGNVDLTQLALTVSQLEKDLGRAVNYNVYSPVEWAEKLRAKEPFIANVLAEPKIMLIGNEDGLRKTAATTAHPTVPGASGRNPEVAASGRTRSSDGSAHARR